MPNYSLEHFVNLLHNPSRVPIALTKIAIDINRRWYQVRYGFPDTDPMVADWDNLIIIDGARPELLKQILDDTSSIRTVRSPASCSGGFIERVFNDREFHDTVYVTANPHASTDLEEGIFHAVWNLLDTAWCEEQKTVLPEDVVEQAVEAHEQFPSKRLVVHFMQPHFPFLGPTGSDINARLGRTPNDQSSLHPWNEQMWGEMSERESLIQAYRENHEIVHEEVETLLNEIDGKSVVTADHANLIGERGIPIPIRMYGHPIKFPHPNLLTVPWIERGGERRNIIPETPSESESLDEKTVQNRLEALGYR